jgi:hypothetical protein
MYTHTPIVPISISNDETANFPFANVLSLSLEFSACRKTFWNYLAFHVAKKETTLTVANFPFCRKFCLPASAFTLPVTA